MALFNVKTWFNDAVGGTRLNKAGLDDLEARISSAVLTLSVPQAITSVAYGDARFPSQPTSVSEGGIVTTYTYNANGTLATEARLGTTITYTYDSSGNLTGAA